jgi:hypothetical protein
MLIKVHQRRTTESGKEEFVEGYINPDTFQLVMPSPKGGSFVTFASGAFADFVEKPDAIKALEVAVYGGK